LPIGVVKGDWAVVFSAETQQEPFLEFFSSAEFNPVYVALLFDESINQNLKPML